MRTLALLPVLAAGCDLALDFESDATRVTAAASGDGATEVSICAGPSDLLTCNDAERFRVAMGAILVENDGVHAQLFGARVARLGDDRPGLPIVVTRLRDGAEMAVELPLPFTLTSPAPGAVVSREDGLTLRWSAAGAPGAWRVSAFCAGAARELDELDDDDRAIALGGDDLPSGGCAELRLTVERRRGGRVGRGFEDGSTISGVQRRSVAVHLVL
jgi:hypothetical protein